jgi:cell division initiation protein
MKLTPIDVKQQQFRRVQLLGGFDTREVDGFLDQVAVAFEELIREVNALKAQIADKEAQLDQHRDREKALKETMITATRIADEVKQSAHKEAEIIIAAAENQAEGIIQNAHTRLARVMDDISELKRQKVQFEASLRSIVGAHGKLLEAMAEREPVSTDLETRREPRGGKVTPIAAAADDERRKGGQGR